MRKKNKETEIDTELVDKKVLEIGRVLEGLRFSEILTIIGTVIVELVYNAARQKDDASPVIFEWLKTVGAEVYKAREKLFNKVASTELN